MTRPICFLALALMIIPLAPALAGDLRPPSFRFRPWTTVAGWDFLTEQNIFSIQPDANVPLWIGDAKEALQVKFPEGAQYPSAALFGDVRYSHANGGGYFGGSFGDGGVVFVVPNWLEVFDFQFVRLQVIYQGLEPPTTVVGYAGIPGDPGGNGETRIVRVPVSDPSLPPGTAAFYEEWWMSPSSTWQQVVVFLPAETILLEVVIDSMNGKLEPVFEDGFEPGDISPWRPH